MLSQQESQALSHRFNVYLRLVLFALLLSTSAASIGSAATIVVNSLADSVANDGACTLREAMINANKDDQSGAVDCAAGNGADVIAFDVAGTITLSGTLPAIGERCAVIYDCPLVNVELAIDGADQITISAGNLVPLFLGTNCSDSGMFPDNPCEAGGSLTLRNLALVGVGIVNNNRLSIQNVIVSGNNSAVSNGGRATATILGGLFSNNAVGLSTGSVILNFGNLRIFGTTFSGNGGAYVIESIHDDHFADQRHLFVNLSTFANNSGVAISTREGLKAMANISSSTISGNGAAIRNAGTNSPRISNSILANSTGMGGNCSGGVLDQGYNIDDGNSCGFGIANNSKPNTDPLLDPAGLKYNVGASLTLALCTGVNTPSFGCSGISPAIDSGAFDGCLDGDNDGTAVCDIGAFESGAVPGPIIVGSPRRVPQGEFVTVTWSGVSVPAVKDWIAIYRSGNADSAYLSWAYTSSCQTISGAAARAADSCILFVPFGIADGLYDLRLLANDGFKLLAIGSIVVGGPPLPPPPGGTLAVNPPNVDRGTYATVSWSGIANPTTKDWLGLYPLGSPNTAYQAWVYASSCQTSAGASARASGTCGLYIPTIAAPGSYEIRMLSNDGFKLLTSAAAVLVQ